MTGPVVAIMARAPSSGGKSRLIRDLGDCDGTALRAALLADTLESISTLAASKLVLYTPADGEAEIRALTSFPAAFLPQRGITIGDRMREGAHDLLARGFNPVVIVGSDLPTLPAAHVIAALDWLAKRQEGVVLGPAHDGGYYLIGLTQRHGELFEHIPWGTPLVLKRTQQVAAAMGLPVELLPEWYDVDSASDLSRVCHASSAIGAGRHTRAWIAAAAPAVRARVEGETT